MDNSVLKTTQNWYHANINNFYTGSPPLTRFLGLGKNGVKIGPH